MAKYSIGKVWYSFMRPSYYTFKPSAHLSGIVSHYWVTTTDFEPNSLTTEQTCLPLGTAEWIIQVRGELQLGKIDNEWRVFPSNYVVGLMDKPVHWKMHGNSQVIGISLKPEWFSAIFRFPLNSVHNAFIEAQFLDNPIFSLLRNHLLKEENLEKQVALVDEFLIDWMDEQKVANEFFVRAVGATRTGNALFSTKALRDNFYLCDRQIQRLFKSHFGLSPKAYERITRFSHTIERITQNPKPCWNTLADELGYSDRAHLVREFKYFAGFTPSSTNLADSSIHRVMAK
ncbi:helix-turn-helix domain-containing protein [Roseivirga thermotolerans]|nr:helix-turn-helix domain-containing protein [Roseivirga thermotolerans]